MQVPVLGCTFLTLSEREESTAENRQLSERGSAPIIRALMISALMIGAQQWHPQVSPTCAQQYHPPVPSSAPTCATLQCHTPVPRSATYLCPEVPPTCAHPPVPTSATHPCHPPVPTHQCHPPVQPSSAASQCHQSVSSGCASQCRQSVPSSAASQCHQSVVTYQCRLSVLHISAAYP
ncbi:unnamed protein product [Staurois parvus]|uniref:Uncharacterized protein n=1 Tax=Staurois parvus TaxID=386267 RepID=A0ABN9AIG7_9NEOB|nr:unnamed protein product [Staurois parvus]